MASLAAETRNTDMDTYAYRPLETATTIRLLYLGPGKQDDPLAGDLRHTELSGYETSLSGPQEKSGTGDYFSDDFRASEASSRELSGAFENMNLTLCDDSTGSGTTEYDPTLHTGSSHDTDSPTIGPPTYEALSYVWGSPKYDCSFACPTGIIPITGNLDLALRRMRHVNRECVLWADAICINQFDVEERGHQVGLMGRVYAQASQVLIWLGIDSDNVAGRVFDSILSDASMEASGYDFQEGYELRRRVDHTLCTLSQLPWFSRLWVVQELLLAKSAILFWGDEWIDCIHVQSLVSMVRIGMHGLERRRYAWMCSDTLKYGVLDLLQQLRVMHCLDERDRIYAIQGLLQDQSPLSHKIRSITIDYTQEFADLFFEVACICVECDEVSQMLLQVDHVDDVTAVSSTLPSWAPDWRHTDRHNEYRRVLNLQHPMMGNNTPPLLDLDNRILTLVGYSGEAITYTTAQDLDPDSLLSCGEQVAMFWQLRILPYRTSSPELWAEIEMSFITTMSLILALPRDVDMWQYLVDLFVPPNMDPDALPQSTKAMLEYFTSQKTTATSRSLVDFANLDFDRNNWFGRRLFQTCTGYVGLGPGRTRAGDILTMLSGVDVPVVVRQEDDRYRFVGAATSHSYQKKATEHELITPLVLVEYRLR